MISHADLVSVAERWLHRQHCGVVFRELRASTPTGEQPDAIGWRHHISILVECKATRSDFLADSRKKFRANPASGCGDWRFYLSPPKVITPDDLPPNWGLLWAQGKRVRQITGVPSNTGWHQAAPFHGDKTSEVAMMYCALRRLSLRGQLPSIYEPLEALR